MNMTDDEDLRVIGSLLREVKSLAAPQATGVAQINVSAGGVGIWISVTACLMMLAAMLIGSIFVAVLMSDHARKIERLEDYLSAIYAQAPDLKPKTYEKEEK